MLEVVPELIAAPHMDAGVVEPVLSWFKGLGEFAVGSDLTGHRYHQGLLVGHGKALDVLVGDEARIHPEADELLKTAQTLQCQFQLFVGQKHQHINVFHRACVEAQST